MYQKRAFKSIKLFFLTSLDGYNARLQILRRKIKGDLGHLYLIKLIFGLTNDMALMAV